MYCYFLNKRFWEEKVAWVTWCSWSAGDLMLIDEEYVLVLWEHITASELVHGAATAVKTEVVYTSLCSRKTLQCMHRFVGHWFTSYTNTVPLRLWSDLPALLKRRQKKLSSISRTRNAQFSPEGKVYFSATSPTTTQQLLVFPDIWTMHQQLPAKVFDQPWVVRRHSWLTSLQKATIFWWCKVGSIHTLISTPAGVFQDWSSLWAIMVIDGHKRRYKGAQDPRWRIPTVMDSFTQIYECAYTTSWVFLQSS